MKNKKRRKRSKREILRDKVWKVFSRYKRKDGVCFTCGARKHPKELDAGHFIHKDCLDFNEFNIHAQCSRCNRFLHGNLGEYALRLFKKYGNYRSRVTGEVMSILDYLKIEGNKEHKFTIQELEDLYEEYKAFDTERWWDAKKIQQVDGDLC